jgi:DNA mismatch repair protein MutS2
MDVKTLRVLEFNKIKDLLAEKTVSDMARELATELSYINNQQRVEFLQNETEEALSLLLKRGAPPIYGLYPLKKDVKRAELGGMLHPGSLLKIKESLRTARAFKNYLKATVDESDINYPIIQEMTQDLSAYKSIEDEIENAIISENEIADNASSLLKSIRRQIRIKNDAVRDKLNSMISSQTYKKYLQDSIVTMRQGRYVLPVKNENRANVSGLVHDMSSSGATAFIEPMAVVELNNQLKEMEIQENDEIERILLYLSGLVANEAQGIKNNEILLTRLDFVFAKGKLALDMNASKPVFNTRGYINIKNARHPLLGKNVVPISVYLGKDFNTLIITGPNTGGKTVTLKTVGLLTIMGQSGLHIPADYNSELAVFDKVYADIGDEQSIEQSLSTFSSHMTNIVSILEKVKENSLVLFDELGAGTDPTEGAALAMSILDNLKEKNIRTIATTHYSQLKIYALTNDKVRNAAVEFDVETLSPTYKLLIGVPGKSNAFEISKRLGLTDHIIDEARSLISKENIAFEDVLQALDLDRRTAEENKLESQRIKLEIDRLKKDLQNEKSKISDLREKTIQKAKEEAKRILRDAKDNAELIIDEIRDISQNIDKDSSRRLQQAQEMLKKEVDKRDSEASGGLINIKVKKPPKDLKPGETVELLSLNQRGSVITAPDEKGNVEVQVGIMKVNVALSSLRRTDLKEKDINIAKTKSISSRKSKSIKQEVDLRGLNIEEGIFETDKYLDDAYISGLKEVYIIHGKGTGVLREGIKSFLKTHKHVKSIRTGKYGEGGDGVTVAELK